MDNAHATPIRHHNRLRIGISPAEGLAELRMMMWPAYVAPQGRTRIKKSLTIADLAQLAAAAAELQLQLQLQLHQ
ncbi:hypothetical protein ABT381_05125 [Streptomyces sp. NPDC000151]|uniref:hypothetical protein n=1 Tax=Streptomyces sp. NPDC000151 TaxID=3154244 RepID=UPI0033343C96